MEISHALRQATKFRRQAVGGSYVIVAFDRGAWPPLSLNQDAD